MHVERAQRGMRGRKIRMDHLPHAFGSTEVLQPVRTQVGQVHAVGQLIDDQPGGCVRHEDLVTVSDRSKASASDHGLTEVVAFVAQLRFAGVDRHAHVEVRSRRPGLGHERSLGIDRRGHGIGGTGERGDHAVALPLLDRAHPTVAGDDLVQDLVVPGNGRLHRCWRLFPALGRPFDIGQQEGDRAGRKREAGRVRAAHLVHQETSDRRIDLTANHGVSIRDPDHPDIPHLVDQHFRNRGSRPRWAAGGGVGEDRVKPPLDLTSELA